MKYRLAGVERGHGPDCVVPLQVAGPGAPLPVIEHRSERLNLHHEAVALRNDEIGFRFASGRHGSQLCIPALNLAGADADIGQATNVGSQCDQVVRVGIQLCDNDCHLRIRIQLLLDIHRRWPMQQGRSDQPLGVFAVADPARDSLEKQRFAPCSQVGYLFLSIHGR